MWLVCSSPWRGNTCGLKLDGTSTKAKKLHTPMIHRLPPPVLKTLDEALMACGLDPLEIGKHPVKHHVYRPFGDTIAGMAILRLPPDYGSNCLLAGGGGGWPVPHFHHAPTHYEPM